MNEAINYVQIAVDAMPENPRYAYTLAFYQFKDNQKSKAVKTLKKIIDETPQYLNAVSLLCDIYTRDGKNAEAIAIYKKALLAEGVSEENKTAIRQAINILEQIK
jgi:Tfp pilus assembly protein PilF